MKSPQQIAEEKYPDSLDMAYAKAEIAVNIDSLGYHLTNIQREAFIAGMQEAQQAGEGLREALEKIANIKFIDDRTVYIFIKIAREALSGKQETEKS